MRLQKKALLLSVGTLLVWPVIIFYAFKLTLLCNYTGTKFDNTAGADDASLDTGRRRLTTWGECRSSKAGQLTAIVAVESLQSDILHRTGLRHAWSQLNAANRTRNLPSKLIFFVHYLANSSWDEAVLEFYANNDLVLDSKLADQHQGKPQLLPAATQWMRLHCLSVAYLIYADSRAHLRPSFLPQLLSSLRTRNESLIASKLGRCLLLSRNKGDYSTSINGSNWSRVDATSSLKAKTTMDEALCV